MRQEFKQDLKDMEDRHTKEIERVENRHQDELEKVEAKAEKREGELMRLLTMFGDKFSLLNDKIDEVIKKLDR